MKPGLHLNETSDIVRDTKIKRLEGLGHLIRRKIHRIPKVATDAKLKGKRKVGRPKLQWEIKRVPKVAIDTRHKCKTKVGRPKLRWLDDI